MWAVQHVVGFGASQGRCGVGGSRSLDFDVFEGVLLGVTAAIVIVVCLTAGAATAAYVFQDSLTRITALRSASR